MWHQLRRHRSCSPSIGEPRQRPSTHRLAATSLHDQGTKSWPRRWFSVRFPQLYILVRLEEFELTGSPDYRVVMVAKELSSGSQRILFPFFPNTGAGGVRNYDDSHDGTS